MFKYTLVSVVSFVMMGKVMASNVEMDCEANRCDLRYSGHKSKNLEIPRGIDFVKIRYSGSGDLALEGKVKEIKLSSRGSGEMDLQDLLAESIDLDYSGSGAVHLYASEAITGYHEGSGKIVVRGGAKVDLKGEGNGRIVER